MGTPIPSNHARPRATAIFRPPQDSMDLIYVQRYHNYHAYRLSMALAAAPYSIGCSGFFGTFW